MEAKRKEIAAKRQGRASEMQIDAMVNYFSLHPYVANNKFQGMLGKKRLEGSWEELTDMLNAMFNNGKNKSVNSWKTTWRDTKTKISNKLTNLKKNRVSTGNKSNEITLTERDKKVLGIVGYDYIEGLSTVPDSFPEELENIYERLEEGDATIEEVVPQVITMRPMTTTTVPDEEEIVSELLSIDSVALDVDANIREDIEVNSIPDATIPDPVTFNQSAKNVIFNQSAEIVTQEKHIDQTVFKCKAANTPAVAKSRMPVTSRARFLRKEERLGVQINEARKNFTSLAERTCQATEVLAQAEKMRAEAALIQVENNRLHIDILRTMAENDKARNELLLRLVHILDAILQR